MNFPRYNLKSLTPHFDPTVDLLTASNMKDEEEGEDLMVKHLLILSLLKCQVQSYRAAALICELRRPGELPGNS